MDMMRKPIAVQLVEMDFLLNVFWLSFMFIFVSNFF